MGYKPLDALELMVNVGPARLAYDGVMVNSGEYVAALYESYAADQEFAFEYGTDSASLYASAAQVAAEDLWTRDIGEVQ